MSEPDTVDLTEVDWAALIPAACAADSLTDYKALPYPRGIPDSARRAVTVWCRHPTTAAGTLNWQGEFIVGDGAGDTRPATENDPGDQLAYELIGQSPTYPTHPERPTDAIHTAWQKMVTGEPDEPDDETASWWPATIIIDRRTPDTRPWLDLYAHNGQPISHTRLGHGRTAHDTSTPNEPPTTFHGRPLATVDSTDALAVVVENIRVRSSPTGRRPGRPPATSTVIEAMTPRQKLTAAIELVEQHGWPQATAARAANARADSLNKALARRKQQR